MTASALQKKTDNHSLQDKVNLRRLLVKEAQMEPLRVLDLYAGDGLVWQELRRQPRYDPDLSPEDQPRALQVQTYTPVDVVAKQPGQLNLKISPRLIAGLNGDADVNAYSGTDLGRYNTVEVDCYGDPWEIWHELLFRIKQRTIVFITRGRVSYGQHGPGSGKMPISKLAKRVMGIPESWNVPGRKELLDYGDRCQLLQPCKTARIAFGYEIKFPRVSYYGVLVEPIDINIPGKL